MQIYELIFQGVLGDDRPRRLRPEGTLSRLTLPESVSVEAVHDLILACLYPAYLTEDMRQRLDLGEETKLAAVLNTTHGMLRVIRRADHASVRLQRKTDQGYVDVVSGATTVQAFLQEKLHFPRLKVFLPLHLWQFDAAQIPHRPEGAQFGDDPRIPELVEMYLTALEVESVEDKIKELEVRVREGMDALGQGAEVEEKLIRAQEKLAEVEIQAMSSEEIELIRTKDEILEDFQEQLQRLRSEEETEARQVRTFIPESPLRVPRFWLGLAVAVIAMALSFYFHESHRLLALLAIPGLGICAFQMLQFFNWMGRASVHQVRLSSIRRRIDQVLSEEILFLDRIEHILLHAGVEDEEELRQRIPMAAKLRRIIAKIEEQLDIIRANPDYRAARKQLTSLQDELAALQAERSKLPDFVMNSFQLESDLQTVGVDPVAVREGANQTGEDALDDQALDLTPFAWLRAVAEWTDQWHRDGLDEDARQMWSNICGHVLSERFADVNLSAEGDLLVGSLTKEQRELWQRTRSSEVHLVKAALALALHINGQRRLGKKAFAALWIADPATAMTPGHATKFESVFKSAAKKSQIVICGAPQ